MVVVPTPITAVHRWLAALGIPLFFYFAMRFFTREVAGVRLGFGWIGTDYDFVPHFVLALSLMLFTLSDACGELRPKRKKVFVSLCLLFGFCLYTYLCRSVITYQNILAVSIWFAMAATVLLGSLSVCFPADFFFRQAHLKQTIAVLFIGLSGVLSGICLKYVGDQLVYVTSKSCFVVLNSLLHGLTYELRDVVRNGLPEAHGILGDGRLTIVVGRGCSGMEGISLFAFVAGLLWIAQNKRASLFNWFTFLVFGVSFLYLANILRVTLFFLISYCVASFAGPDSVEWALGLFHKSIGFVVYAFSILFVNAVFFRWLVRDASLPCQTRTIPGRGVSMKVFRLAAFAWVILLTGACTKWWGTRSPNSSAAGTGRVLPPAKPAGVEHAPADEPPILNTPQGFVRTESRVSGGKKKKKDKPKVFRGTSD